MFQNIENKQYNNSTRPLTKSAVPALGIVGTVGAALYSGASQAAILAADLTAVTTEVTTDLGVITTWAVGLVGAVLAVTIGIGLMKNMGKKAAS